MQKIGHYMRVSAIFMVLCLSQIAFAKLSILTTIPDLAVLSQEIGEKDVSVDSIVKGTQDPHFVEAKPSFMTRAARADLLISVGLDLEMGWLPSVIQGSRNPKIINPKRDINLTTVKVV